MTRSLSARLADDRPGAAKAPWRDRFAALLGTLALIVVAWPVLVAPVAMDPEASDAKGAAAATGAIGRLQGIMAGREAKVGAYLGATHTHASEVVIRNPGKTDVTVKDFTWIGLPFKSPIYYGLRAMSFTEGSRFGVLLDFTHAKAIARAE